MSNHFSSRILSTEFVVSLQIALVGFLVTEVWYLAKAIGDAINVHILSHNAQVYVFPTILIILIAMTLYLILGDSYKEAIRLKRSKRYSAAAFLLVGIFFSASAAGIGTELYQNFVERLGGVQLILIVLIPVLFYIGFVVKVLFKKKHNKQAPSSFFINDQAIEFANEDLLDVKSNAARFAEQVLNNGASDSLVFGVDSAWGVGKSSFINLCSNYWSEQENSNIIVVRFEPLRYKESADLVDAYVNELVIAIQNHVFAPTVQSLFYKYLKLVKGVRSSSILGVNLTIERPSVSAHEILDSISSFLSEMDMRIIVVVDDLDRLSWAEVKKILFSIKRSFMLPNVSYVLCYDTENFSSKGKEAEDAGKVKEFLEKYVNIKISLFLSSNRLSKYVSENTESVLRSNLHLDPRTRANIEGTISWLKTIYSSKDFYRYANLVGDIRKLKRLINTLLSLGIYSTDYDNTDYDKGDLLHLLLIYVNFPHIFRDIYNAETDGKNGVFSLTKELMGDDKFNNSDDYNTYIEPLSDDQKLLLSKLFDAGNIGKNRFIRACYNGDGYTGRNLERYLKLIVNQVKQDKLDSYQFYVTMKDKFIHGKSLDEIFRMEEFGFAKGDFVRREFWNIISNSSGEITPFACKEAITHILGHLPDYSFLDEDGVSADTRVSLIYVLLHLLDGAAWKTEGSRGSVTNSNERVEVISDWVFGENGYSDKGVISTLSQTDRGVLGLHDLLLFRLYCSADKGGSLFNLHRALSLHEGPDAPTQGSTIDIAKEGMRKISQQVFQVFMKQYIKPKKNVFEQINQLTLQELTGESYGYAVAQQESGKLDEDKVSDLVDRAKMRAASFIVYQLGNSSIESGVGCGYYDPEGNDDNKGIAAAINDYLFDVCFNPTIDENNYEYFLNYLLRNFTHTFDDINDPNYTAKIDAITKILLKAKLKSYWMKHKAKINALEFIKKDMAVPSGNYVATYKQHLPLIFNALDLFLKETIEEESKAPNRTQNLNRVRKLKRRSRFKGLRKVKKGSL